MEDAGAFTVVEEAFAVEFASVACDGEFHVLLAGLREIDAAEIAHGPVGLMVRIVVTRVVDEPKFDFTWFVAMRDGPAARAGVGSASNQGEKKGAGDQDISDQSVAAIHFVLLHFEPQKPARLCSAEPERNTGLKTRYGTPGTQIALLVRNEPIRQPHPRNGPTRGRLRVSERSACRGQDS